jgi:hypothetical protein
MDVAIGLAVVVLVIVLGVTVAVHMRNRTPQDTARRADLRSARGELREAERARTASLKTSQKSLSAAEKDYGKSVNAAEQALAQLTDPDGPKLARYGGMTLYERAIHTPNGRSSLAGATATVDTAGNLTVTKRVTATRLVTGGIVGGLLFKKKETHDSRELYLLMETDELSSAVECPPDDGVAARAFAARIETAAKQESLAAPLRPALVAQAQHDLDAVRGRTSVIDACKQGLAQVEADPSLLEPIARAQARIAELTRPVPLEADGSERLTRRGVRRQR